MRVFRYAVVVCVLVGAAGVVYAGPREAPKGLISKIVKKIRILGDLITVPIPAPTPKP